MLSPSHPTPRLSPRHPYSASLPSYAAPRTTVQHLATACPTPSLHTPTPSSHTPVSVPHKPYHLPSHTAPRTSICNLRLATCVRASRGGEGRRLACAQAGSGRPAPSIPSLSTPPPAPEACPHTTAHGS
eukprot:2479251-Rhodomonas_salina.1